MFNISNIFNMFKTTNYKAIFESDKRVLIGHRKALDDDDEFDEEEITVPRYEVEQCGRDTWSLDPNICYSEDDVWFPTRWYNLKGKELCRVINEDYELYKASGEGKRLLKHFKPSIDDAIESGYSHVIFKSKESAVIAGKIAIFLDKYYHDKNKPDWLY